ncbi:MAG: hypothetical protein LBF54_02530 [Holosporaceae bacterium]|jgi:hypothetical protein|nr:hypothetical protein [Holosporaceae bacterium]
MDKTIGTVRAVVFCGMLAAALGSDGMMEDEDGRSGCGSLLKRGYFVEFPEVHKDSSSGTTRRLGERSGKKLSANDVAQMIRSDECDDATLAKLWEDDLSNEFNEDTLGSATVGGKKQPLKCLAALEGKPQLLVAMYILIPLDTMYLSALIAKLAQKETLGRDTLMAVTYVLQQALFWRGDSIWTGESGLFEGRTLLDYITAAERQYPWGWCQVKMCLCGVLKPDQITEAPEPLEAQSQAMKKPDTAITDPDANHAPPMKDATQHVKPSPRRSSGNKDRLRVHFPSLPE